MAVQDRPSTVGEAFCIVDKNVRDKAYYVALRRAGSTSGIREDMDVLIVDDGRRF